MNKSKYHRIVTSFVGGYVGGKQQRCIICDRKNTIWACSDCSVAPHSLVPLCPPETKHKGVVRYYDCLEKHRQRPNWYPKGKNGRNFCGPKRRRTVGSIDGDQVDDCPVEEMSCGECDSE